MTHLARLVALTVLLAALAGCGSSRPGDPPRVTPGAGSGTTEPAPDLSDAVITIERGACFGTCPVYVLTLRGDGTVTFVGTQFVEARKGTATVDAALVQDLARDMMAGGFWDMKDSIDKHVTDLPTYTYTLSVPGRAHTVRYYGLARSAAEPWAERADGLANVKQWIGNAERSPVPTLEPVSSSS